MAALVAATVLYAPALGSGFWSDDYAFLVAARQQSLGDFIGDSLAGSSDSFVHGVYWRPLSLLSFRGLYTGFGTNPTPYHLTVFLGHLVSIGLIWCIGRRLSRGSLAPALAAVVFAVHPATFESVAWGVATINNLALPFALAAWLALLPRGAEGQHGGHSRARLVGVACLGMVALGFRETGVIVILAIAAVHVALVAGERPFDRRRLLPLAPLAGVLLLFVVVRQVTYDAPGQIRPTPSLVLENYWSLLQQALVPFHGSGPVPPSGLRVAGAIVVLIAPLVLLARRRWVPFTLWMTFLVSLVPYSLTLFGGQARYLYFPSALFALALGVTAQRLVPAVARHVRPAVAARVGAGTVAALAVGATLYALPAVTSWVEDGPKTADEFLSDLRDAHPDLADADVDTLYVTNLPLELSVFDAYAVPLMIDVAFQVEVQVELIEIGEIEHRRATLEPDDRLFVFRPDRGGCAAAAPAPAGNPDPPRPLRARVRVVGEPPLPPPSSSPITLLDIALEDGSTATVTWETDGSGRTRFRLNIPYFPPASQPWQAPEPGSWAEVALVPDPARGSYELLADGEVIASVPMEAGGARLHEATFAPNGAPAEVQIEGEVMEPSPC